jgi:DNA (cytosine-5)-methyltransferase 1
VRHYVQGIPIKAYSIEGYGEEQSPRATVYIQSKDAGHDPKYDIWFRLGDASRRYAKYHRVFSWISILGKHTIDFLETRPDGARVGLGAFRQEFHKWLTQRFPHSSELGDWLKTFGDTDFRRSINAHIDYIGQEAYNLPNHRALFKHRLWADCMRDDHHSIRAQPIECDKTVATPYTYRCFKNRYFAEFITEVQPSDEVQNVQNRRKRLLGFPSGTPPQTKPPGDALPSHNGETPVISIGDVVAVLPDEAEERLWRKQAKDITPDNEWFAYVQNIKTTKDGDQRLFVIWMYRPEDTTISTTDYPVSKELFLSDHCNCTEPELLAREVGSRCSIDWFSRAMDTRHHFLVRQKYVTAESSFVTLKNSDFQCDCGKPKSTINNYDCGDSVYITSKNDGEDILEPVVIHEIYRERKEVIVRRLLRLRRDCRTVRGNISRQNVADNELVWTDELFRVPCRRVQRKCHVRCFPRTDVMTHAIPFPYNRGGAGDFWVLSAYVAMSGETPYIESLPKPPALLNQGADHGVSPSPIEKLQGLSLFSGCGNLDNGLEESRVVEFKTVVEMCVEAVQTIHANARHPGDLKIWLGSVDDYLKALLVNENNDLVASIGEVAVIAAGSPCPGFSTLQQDWKSAKSLRNASHVTTFCSFLDIYRPKYAFLENVVNMACTRVGYEEERVLSQIIACLVSMGYQVCQFIMSAWNYGSPQRRSRLILSIAAPGLVPLAPPPHTHSRPDNYRSKSIGDLLNGQKFGTQDDGPTPLPFVTAGKATAHLPDIGNGNVQGCIEYPDHRLPRPINYKERTIMTCIPTNPPGQGLAEAIKLRSVPEQLYEGKNEIGTAYKRMKKDGLFPTIVTRPSPHCARGGAVVHWSQNRPYSIEEARVAQGMPTGDVIIGSVAEQMKMVGNAVDRRVSEQLGLSLRHALEQCSPEILHADDIGLNTYTAKAGTRKGSLIHIEVPSFHSHTAHLLSLPVHKKRSRDESEDSTGASNAESIPSKREGRASNRIGSLEVERVASFAEHIKYTRSTNSPLQQTVSSDEPQVFYTSAGHHGSKESAKMTRSAFTVTDRSRSTSVVRKTRHSGLKADSAPNNWSKVPEKEIKKARELARRGSRLYA